MSIGEMTNYKNDTTDQGQAIPYEIMKNLTIKDACKAEIFGLCCVCRDQFYCPWKGAGINKCEKFKSE